MKSPLHEIKKQIDRIFFPNANENIDRIRATGSRFVHYTSAEVAINILAKGEVWMRNSQTMNDYMEFQHGFDCLDAAYRTEPGILLKETLASIFPGIVEELQNRFHAWAPIIKHGTFLTCISEHLPSEDIHGRLSMWRAYGGGTGVALVLNNSALIEESTALKAYTNPVAYLDDKSFAEEFLRVVEQISKEANFIQGLGKDRVIDLVFHMFRFASLCTKHPGFHEEKEWRVIYSPAFEQSTRLIEDVVSVRGVPQKIYKIPLKNVPQEGLFGIEIPELLERIIIGPTQYPQAIYQAFHKLLTDANVPDPESKIFVSKIPLRQ